jgi:brefeldin A-resistance guanine nucleotide exchange factor 1
MEEFLAGTPAIPLKVRVKQEPPEEKRRNDGGLLSTLSSYLMSPYANGAEGIGRELTDNDVEHTLSTIDCIASCRVDSLYSAVM